MLLVDAGDMWQGTLASNLSEGTAVVRAYNALGYDAVAIGNHEFDFGPQGPQPVPRRPEDDARGALVAGAREANASRRAVAGKCRTRTGRAAIGRDQRVPGSRRFSDLRRHDR